MKFYVNARLSHCAIYVSHRNSRYLNWRLFCMGGCGLIVVSTPSLIPLPRIFIYQLTSMRLASLYGIKGFQYAVMFLMLPVFIVLQLVLAYRIFQYTSFTPIETAALLGVSYEVGHQMDLI